MSTQKNLFAKALLVDKPWFVHKIKFDQKAGKLNFSKINSHYFTHLK